jgi:uncharacterized coiled-coil protein SlyX
MNISDAITKLRVMLGAEEVVTKVELEDTVVEETVAVKMASVELIDGTILTTESELTPGAILVVEVAEGEAPFAPEGKHSTVDGLILTVGMNGELLSVEEEAPAAEPVTEVPATTEVSVEFSAEELLSGVAAIIAPYQAKIDALSNELNVLTERFNSVADLPAAEPVKRNFMEDARAAKQVAEARLSRLAQIRKFKS